MDSNIEYILKLCYEKDVKFIKLWFSDIQGILKTFAITKGELEDAMSEGVRFDGSTLNGLLRRDEHELIAMPDPSTFQILPWRPQEDSVARMFCTIHSMDMKPCQLDSRYILKRTLEKAASLGYRFYTGPEIEFYLFKNSSTPELIDIGGYFDQTPLDLATDYRRQIVLTLEKMGVDIISSHHEGGPSQHEIDLRHEDALTTADNIMTFKIVSKEIAQKNNAHASFMPKPLSSANGSGMHIHMSLFQNDENIFYDSKTYLNLSDKAKSFMAGIIKHAPEFTALTNQWVNSYRRFVAGCEAPMNLSWSQNANTALLRIPQMRTSKPSSMRIELRTPDPACNPYLSFAAVLSAGLKGIEECYQLSPELEETVQLSGERNGQFELLPKNLVESIQLFSKSELMKETLGQEMLSLYTENKMMEVESFNRHVSDYEVSKFFHLL